MSVTPSGKKRMGAFALLSIGIVLGIVLWGGFNWTLELTNTEEFCVSCHEMRDTPFKELQDTIHYSNRTGVRATCPDCHVPRPWVYKIVRKIQASNELFHHFVTKDIDTPAKYEEKRFELAKNVWTAMKKTDSRECRNCHDYVSMDFEKQQQRAVQMHEEMDPDAKAKEHKTPMGSLTCIDCHKGIAHHLPKGYDSQKDVPGSSVYYRQ